VIDGLRSKARQHDSALKAPSRPGLGRWLARHGVSADVVTVVGIALSAATGVLIGAGWLWAAVAFLIVGGLMDTLDGAVAKAAGTSSRRGAFFDSVADRVADGLIFGGVAWYLLGRPDPRLALLPFAILGVSAVVSYERAKAESLGLTARGGLMERAERLILLGVGLGFHVVLVPVLWLLLVLTACTAAGRFVRVWRQASAPAALPVTRPNRTWRPGRVESRWRAWRETGDLRDGTFTAARSRLRERRSAAGAVAASRRASRLRSVLGNEAPRAGRDRAGKAASARALRRRYDAQG
jgi:CDP-diacylglycerol--glycerol-3-phosphate 3-phosphatidyltransferase